MKLVAKSSAYVCISYQVHVKVCNPIPLIKDKPIIAMSLSVLHY